MTSASIRDPVTDHLITPQNAALALIGSSAPICAATPTRPSWSLVTRPSPRDHGHPR